MTYGNNRYILIWPIDFSYRSWMPSYRTVASWESAVLITPSLECDRGSSMVLNWKWVIKTFLELVKNQKYMCLLSMMACICDFVEMIFCRTRWWWARTITRQSLRLRLFFLPEKSRWASVKTQKSGKIYHSFDSGEILQITHLKTVVPSIPHFSNLP